MFYSNGEKIQYEEIMPHKNVDEDFVSNLTDQPWNMPNLKSIFPNFLMIKVWGKNFCTVQPINS